MEQDQYLRYDRQIRLPNFGEAAQIRLLNARVLVIGAGGLGCSALQYLAAAGVGSIGLVDYDVVTISNLHRQVLYTTSDLGKKKVYAAMQRLLAMNPDIQIIPFDTRFHPTNGCTLAARYDVLLDCTDDFETRYLIDDVASLLGLPVVYGALHQFEGHVAVFHDAAHGKTPISYRDIFPEIPENNVVASCSDNGVLGVLPGVIGVFQAAEAIKLITGVGETLSGKLWTIDVRTMLTATFDITPDPSNVNQGSSLQGLKSRINFKNVSCKDDATAALLVDVRESYESSERPLPNSIQIPLHRLHELVQRIPRDRSLLLYCNSGQRSKLAALILQQEFGFKRVQVLADSIDSIS